MKDILIDIGKDAQFIDTNLYKGKNVADVQLGSLTYSQEFGVDKKFFLEGNPTLQISTKSYAAHIIERLSAAGIPADVAVGIASDFADALRVSIERTG